MTLDEAIKHCEEVAAECDLYEVEIEYKCGQEHRQLAEWLKELQELRRQLDVEADNSHCLEIELTKAKELLRKAFGALNDGFCHKDCKQCKWDGGKCNMECRFAWKYGDEASTLLNEEGE